jgi:hypothetical protein
MSVKTYVFGVICFIILVRPVVRCAHNVDQIIGEVPISDVKGEINGISHEIQGHVFPGTSSGLSNMIPRGPLSSLVSNKLRGRGLMGSTSAMIDIVGDAQLFPNIRGHVTLHQIVSFFPFVSLPFTNVICREMDLLF